MECDGDEKSGRPDGFPMSRVVRCLVFLVVCCGNTFSLSLDNNSTTFVEKCRVDCESLKDFRTCGTYRVVRWFHDIVREKEFVYGQFRIVRIPSMQQQSVIPKLPRSRAFKSMALDTLNFVRDAVEDLLTKRALVYTVDNSLGARSFGSMPMIVDESELTEMQNRKTPEDWRLFKKKKSVILPILILLNLLKLKLLLIPIFLGVHFIKKIIGLGILIAPSILSHLKVCKVGPAPPAPAYPYHVWATAAEAPADYPTGYGQDDLSWHRNDAQPYPSQLVYQGYRNPYG